MKSMGAFAFFMLFLAGIALVNLRNVSERKAAQMAPVTVAELTSRDWRLLDAGAASSEHMGDVRLQFRDGGRLSVAAPCNRFNGEFELVDGLLRVHTLAGTRRACSNEVMQAESSLLDILGGILNVSLREATLRFRAGDDQTLATFVAAVQNEGE